MYCPACGTKPGKEAATSIRRAVFIIFGLNIGLFVVVFLIGLIGSLIQANENKKEYSLAAESLIEDYNNAQNADYTPYDVDEIARNMNEDSFSTNYKAKYSDKYLRISGVILDMGYSGQGVSLNPLKEENLKYMSGKKIRFDVFDGYDGEVASDFANSFIKGDRVRVYCKADYLWEDSVELTAYRVEKIPNQ